MIIPATLDLEVQRNAPYLLTLAFEGYDLSEASMDMQVRLRKGAADPALITLTRDTPGDQGLSVVVSEVEGVTVSTTTLQIDEATIDAILPAASNGLKAGSDVELAYDLIITGGGLGRVRWLEGKFWIREGVTV
jgi:hypothetical protein